VIDVRTRFIQAVFRTPEEQKAEATAQFLNDFLPAQFDIFSKLLEKNGNNGFFVGSKVRYSAAAVITWLTSCVWLLTSSPSRHS
jgi:hypothetical protein